MDETNPHRQVAKLVAFTFYSLAGLITVTGIFFGAAAASVEVSRMPFRGVTNLALACMIASMFLTISVTLALLGWCIQRLFGKRRRQEKVTAKAVAGCLRVSSIGCGLWALLSASITIITGKLLVTGEPAGLRDIFAGASGLVLVIIMAQSLAWFVSANYARLTSEDRRRIYECYARDVQLRLSGLADPETRSYLRDRTMDVLDNLDASFKGKLLVFLSEASLLVGENRIALQGADLSGADLRSADLPQADLREVNLDRALLQGAGLFRVNLYRARLRATDLTRANLHGARLSHADLTGANLDRTNLRDVDLRGAKVTPAQWSQARLGDTVLPDGTVR